MSKTPADDLLDTIVDICVGHAVSLGASPPRYCKTHDSFYREPRCSPACVLLTSWSEPPRQDPEQASHARMTQEGGSRHMHQGLGLRRGADYPGKTE